MKQSIRVKAAMRTGEWDYENGRVEVYSRRGEPHRGEYDPKTGEQTKPPDPRRSVEP